MERTSSHRNADARAGPLFSVIVPCRGRPRRLRRALDSVLGQSVTDWELLVVDDASPDPLASLIDAVSDPRIRCLRLDRNLGPGGARDAGLDAARGRFVAFLDSDDVWRPDFLARQCAALERHPGDVVVAGAHLPGRDGWRRLPKRPSHPHERIGAYLFVANQYAQISGVAAPRKIASAARFGSLRQYEDWGFLIRAEAAGAAVRVSDEALLTRPDDMASDRSGAKDDAARAAAFLAEIGHLLEAREREGFRLRCLSPALARTKPMHALVIAVGALLRGRAPQSAAFKLLLRIAIGESGYGLIRRLRVPQGKPRRSDRALVRP